MKGAGPDVSHSRTALRVLTLNMRKDGMELEFNSLWWRELKLCVCVRSMIGVVTAVGLMWTWVWQQCSRSNLISLLGNLFQARGSLRTTVRPSFFTRPRFSTVPV